jgi:hypothetical protein
MTCSDDKLAKVFDYATLEELLTFAGSLLIKSMEVI